MTNPKPSVAAWVVVFWMATLILLGLVAVGVMAI